MKAIFKKFFSVFLALWLIVSLATTAFADVTDLIYWGYDKEKETLYLSTGAESFEAYADDNKGSFLAGKIQDSEGWGKWDAIRRDVPKVVVLNGITPNSMANWFAGFTSATEFDLSKIDTSKVTDMSSLFFGCQSVKTLDLSGFDTSNVTDMNKMFASCFALTSLDLSGFNTEKVTNMQAMFRYDNELETVDITSFNTKNVTNMSAMFQECNMEKLDLSNFAVSKETDCRNMLKDMLNLKYLVLSRSLAEKDVSEGDWLTVTGFDGRVIGRKAGPFDVTLYLDNEYDMVLWDKAKFNGVNGSTYTLPTLEELNKGGYYYLEGPKGRKKLAGWSYEEGGKVIPTSTIFVMSNIELHAIWEHEHGTEWTYSADENVLKATCGEGCDGLTLTLTDPEATFDKRPHLVGFKNGEAEKWVETFEEIPEVSYYCDGDPVTNPINAGIYTAKITVGEATAELTFTIERAKFPGHETPVKKTGPDSDEPKQILSGYTASNETNPDTGAPVFDLAPVAVLVAAVFILSKKH